MIFKNNEVRFKDFFEDVFSEKKNNELNSAAYIDLKKRMNFESNIEYFIENKSLFRSYLERSCDSRLCSYIEKYASNEPRELLEDVKTLCEVYMRSKKERKNKTIIESLKALDKVLGTIQEIRNVSDLDIANYRYLIHEIEAMKIYGKIAIGLTYNNQENEQRTTDLQNIDIQILKIIERFENLNVKYDGYLLHILNDELKFEIEKLCKDVESGKPDIIAFSGRVEEICMLVHLISIRTKKILRSPIDESKTLKNNLKRTYKELMNAREQINKIYEKEKKLFQSSKNQADNNPDSDLTALAKDFRESIRNIIMIARGITPGSVASLLDSTIKLDLEDQTEFKIAKENCESIKDMSEITTTDFFGDLEILKTVDELTICGIILNSSKVLPDRYAVYEHIRTNNVANVENSVKTAYDTVIKNGSSKEKVNAICNNTNPSDNEVIKLNEELSKEIEAIEPDMAELEKIFSKLTNYANEGIEITYSNVSIEILDKFIKQMLDDVNSLYTSHLILAVDTVKTLLESQDSRNKIDSTLTDHLNECLSSESFGVQCSAIETLWVLAKKGFVKTETIIKIANAFKNIKEPKIAKYAVEIILEVLKRDTLFRDDELEKVPVFLMEMMEYPDYFVSNISVEAYAILASQYRTENYMVFEIFKNIISKYPNQPDILVNISKAVYYLVNIGKGQLNDNKGAQSILDELLRCVKDDRLASAYFWICRSIGALAKRKIIRVSSIRSLLLSAVALKEGGYQNGADETSIKEIYEAVAAVVDAYNVESQRNELMPEMPEIRDTILGIYKKDISSKKNRLNDDDTYLPWVEIHSLSKTTFSLAKKEIWSDLDSQDSNTLDLIAELSTVVRYSNNTSTVYWSERAISRLLNDVDKNKHKIDVDAKKNIIEMLETLIEIRSKHAGLKMGDPADYGVRAQSTAVINKVKRLKLIKEKDIPPGAFDIEGDATWEVQNFEKIYATEHDDCEVSTIDIFNIYDLIRAGLEKNSKVITEENVKDIIFSLAQKKYVAGQLRYQLKILTALLKSNNKDWEWLRTDGSLMPRIIELVSDQMELHALYKKNDFDREKYDYSIIAEACKIINEIIKSMDFTDLKRQDANLNIMDSGNKVDSDDVGKNTRRYDRSKKNKWDESNNVSIKRYRTRLILLSILNDIVEYVPDYGTLKQALRALDELASKKQVSGRTIDVICDVILANEYLKDRSVIIDSINVLGTILECIVSQPKLIKSIGNIDSEQVLKKFIQLLRYPEYKDDSEMRHTIIRSISMISQINSDIKPNYLNETLFDNLDNKNKTIRKESAASISKFLHGDDIRGELMVEYLKKKIVQDDDNSTRSAIDKTREAEFEIRKIAGISELSNVGYKFTEKGMNALIEYSRTHLCDIHTELGNQAHAYVYKTLSLCDHLTKNELIVEQNEILENYIHKLIKLDDDETTFSDATYAAILLLRDRLLRNISVDFTIFLDFCNHILWKVLEDNGVNIKFFINPENGTLKKHTLNIINQILDSIFIASTKDLYRKNIGLDHRGKENQDQNKVYDEKLTKLTDAISIMICTEFQDDSPLSAENIVRESTVKEALHSLFPFVKNMSNESILTTERLSQLIKNVTLHIRNTKNTSVLIFALCSAENLIEKCKLVHVEKDISNGIRHILKRIYNHDLLFYPWDGGIIKESLNVIDVAARSNVICTDLYSDFKLYAIKNENDSLPSILEFSGLINYQTMKFIKEVKESNIPTDDPSSNMGSLKIEQYNDLGLCLSSVERTIEKYKKAVEIDETKINNFKKGTFRDNYSVITTEIETTSGQIEENKRNIERALNAVRTQNDDFHTAVNGEGDDDDYRWKLFLLLLKGYDSVSDIEEKLTGFKMIITLFDGIFKNEDVFVKPFDEILIPLAKRINRYDCALAMRLATLDYSDRNKNDANNEVVAMVYETYNNNRTDFSMHTFDIVTDVIRQLSPVGNPNIHPGKVLDLANKGEIFYQSCNNILSAANKSKSKSVIEFKEYLDILEKMLGLSIKTFNKIGRDFMNELYVSVEWGNVCCKCNCEEQTKRILYQIIKDKYDSDTKNSAAKLLFLLHKNGFIGNIPYELVDQFIIEARRENDIAYLSTAYDMCRLMEYGDKSELFGLLKYAVDLGYLEDVRGRKEREYNKALASFIADAANKNVFYDRSLHIMDAMLMENTLDADDMKIQCIMGLNTYSHNKRATQNSYGTLVKILNNECKIREPNNKELLDKYAALILFDMLYQGIIKEGELSKDVLMRMRSLTDNKSNV